MVSSFLGLVGSLSLEEQKLWIPNQVVHDPDTWTAPHLLHLKREYEVLVNKHGCLVREMYTVQDPPAQAPPSEFLLLPPLNCLYKANVRNQEPSQQGDSQPVMPPSQLTLSRQMMRDWEVWNTNIHKSNNHRMLQELAFHAQKTVPATSIQDLNPRPCADNAHTSVMSFEVEAIEPGDGEIPTHTLTWKPLVFLSHIKCRTIDD
jgi:hypothetical protein